MLSPAPVAHLSHPGQAVVREMLFKVAASLAGDYHHLRATAVPAAAGYRVQFPPRTMRDNGNYRARWPAVATGYCQFWAGLLGTLDRRFLMPPETEQEQCPDAMACSAN